MAAALCRTRTTEYDRGASRQDFFQMVEMAIEFIAMRNENLSHMLETPDVLIEVRTHVEIKNFQVRKVTRVDVTVVL